MTLEYMLEIVTILVTFIMGVIVKKNPKISNKAIPLQNLTIGVVMALIEFIITKDFKTSIALAGLLTGGTYDLAKNLRELLGNGDDTDDSNE